ncbi:MAG TPA: DUF4914 family protein [Levilinea sp.]|nr:DUF4914 family protein [Levilinea sp.]
MPANIWRGAATQKGVPSRFARRVRLCSGYALYSIHVEGQQIARWFLQVDSQPEVGVEAYDQGAQMLLDFFRKVLVDLDTPDLAPQKRQIIECCLDNGGLKEYEQLIVAE